MSNVPVQPSHYRRHTIQPIDAIIDWGLSFCLGNVLKYISRAGKKESASRDEDLRKALWYLVFELTSSTEKADDVAQMFKN